MTAQRQSTDAQQAKRRDVGAPARAIALAITLAAGAPAAVAQDRAAVGTISGRDFAGLQLPVPVQRFDVSLSAALVTTWNEGETRRLLLDRDAEVAIGPYQFRADKATVWLMPVEINGERVSQVAVFFDNVRTPGADAAVAQRADRLLVTAIASGQVRLGADKFERGRPYGPFIDDAEFRLSQRLSTLVERGETAFADVPGTPEGSWRPPVAYRVDPEDVGEPVDQPAPRVPTEGVVTFTGPDRTLVTGDDENALVITGGVAIQFQEPAAGRTLHLQADSAVVFLAPRPLEDLGRTTAEDVRGVYLEGGVVATDGEYTLRGPRVFYDIRNNTGVVLDAVFWTYDEQRELPLYLRADVIRQEAADRWSAQDAEFSNVEFFDPHFAIGASAVTIERRARNDGSVAYGVDAKDVKYIAGGAATLRLPRFKGEVEGGRAPRFAIRTRDGDPILYSRWDVYGLMGQRPPDGVTADLLVDGYFDRGPAAGLDARWSTLRHDGEFLGYYFYDDGEDLLGSGARIDRDEESRGMLFAEDRWEIDARWTLFSEAAYVSDPAFLDALFPDIADRRRENRTGTTLQRREGTELLSLELSGAVNDFTPNEYLLQSRGYQVNRLPEVGYYRVGDEILGGAANYFSETRAGYVGFQFTEEPASDFGFDTPALSQRALGVGPNQSPADRLEAQGLTDDFVGRFDTRHEVSAPLSMGATSIVPYAVGRFTAYDDDFQSFSGEDDQTRLWGAVGVDLSTTFVNIDDNVDSAFWDVHRLRHIVEPSVSVWHGETTLDTENLPVYDESVEAIAEGTSYRLGVRSTWQTKRGGLGALRTVDWITLDLNYFDSGADVQRDRPIGRWMESRPELSNFGEFATADASMWLTDAVALVGSTVYDVEGNNGAFSSAGFFVDHGAGFASFADVRYIDPIDSTLVHFGAAYQLTAKYGLDATALYDAEDREFQRAGFTVTRRFPQWNVRLGVDFDDLRDDTSLSIVFRPLGVEDDHQRLQIFPEDRDRRAPESIPLPAARRFGG